MTTLCASPNGMAVSGKKIEPHAVLKAEQRDASDPAEHVWLSASAGTGKTYVLSARVLRQLLRGVKPDAILCLTFTKAGASEMAERVYARLAHWVQIKDPELAAELKALDEKATGAIDILEFVPLAKVERVYLEKVYYLGPDKGGDRAYRLLAAALEETGLAALGQYAARGTQYLPIPLYPATEWRAGQIVQLQADGGQKAIATGIGGGVGGNGKQHVGKCCQHAAVADLHWIAVAHFHPKAKADAPISVGAGRAPVIQRAVHLHEAVAQMAQLEAFRNSGVGSVHCTSRRSAPPGKVEPGASVVHPVPAPGHPGDSI